MKIKNFIKLYFEYTKNFGFINGLKLIFCRYFYKKGTKKVVYNYLKKFSKKIIEDINNNGENITKKQAQKNIWVFWWQGKDNMSKIVASCYNNLLNKRGNYNVVLLSKDNYQNYVTLSPAIETKFQKQIIGMAHFSDILRVNLLKEYGGVWLDTTIYLFNQLSDEIFNYSIYSRKTDIIDCICPAMGRWSTYFWASNQTSNLLFCFLTKFYNKYWIEKNMAIQYLMMDYLIEIAYDNCPKITKQMEQIPFNNRNMQGLVKIINQPYEQKEWDNFIATGDMQKLSWKLNLVENINGKETFYGKIIEENNIY